MELEKLEKIKIGSKYFYKEVGKKVLYSKNKKLDENTLSQIFSDYKRYEIKFI